MRIPLGAIFQIQTPKAYYAYAQYTHQDPHFGKLIRVFKGRHITPQTDLNEIIKAQTEFYTFFAINIALKQKEIEMIGQMPDPKLPFPTFKLLSPASPPKKLRAHAFWDGQKQWKANAEITEEEKNYSTLCSMTSTLLKLNIDRQYTPRYDVDQE